MTGLTIEVEGVIGTIILEVNPQIEEHLQRLSDKDRQQGRALESALAESVKEYVDMLARFLPHDKPHEIIAAVRSLTDDVKALVAGMEQMPKYLM